MIMSALSSNNNHDNNRHQFQRLDNYQQPIEYHHHQLMTPISNMNNQHSIALKQEFEDSNMDANNIDENMTVPHPSRHQTTTTSTNRSNLANVGQLYAGGDMHQQQSYHQQQHLQQSQHNLHQPHRYQQHQHQLQHQQHHHHHQSHQQLHPDKYQQQQQNQGMTGSHQQQDSIREQLISLVQSTQKTEELLRMSRQTQEEFTLQLQSRNKLLANITYQESLAPRDNSSLEKAKSDLNTFECLLKERASVVNKIRCKLLSDQQEIFEKMSAIQQTVLFGHLQRWHRDQQLANNGAKIDNNVLDEIQIWVEMLTDITWRLRNQLKVFHHLITGKSVIPFDVNELNQFGLRLNRSLEILILNTFVVEKQPPQVMKTNTRFASTVRFLSGAKLNVQMINPTVKVTILSENNARAIIQHHQEIIQSSWTYLDCSPHQTQQQQQQQHLAYPNLSRDNQHQSATLTSTPQPQSTHQVVTSQSQQQQQQFFQQQPPPQQFHIQHHQVQPTPSMTQKYQHLQQDTTNSMTYYPQKVLNMNEFDPSGEILNNSNILEFQENTSQLICNFRNMQLKKIKRTEKKGTESVMDEKFVLLFHSEFRIAETYFLDSSCPNSIKASAWIKQGDLSYHIMAFSLPVVVIVHGNQEPHAWATVTWHNAFARPDELLYQVPDKVAWHELGKVLSDKFRSCAGKGLSNQNLDYLASKVCRSNVDSNEVIVSWNQFAKEPLPEKSFTFWEWFHSILKLTKEHLRNLWNADRIYGFVGKKCCVDLLLGSTYHEPTPVGTFLLRYSETELGGITIAWVSGSSQTNKNGCIQVLQRHSPTNSTSNVLMHLQPFVSKDLNTRSLADRIRDLEDLVYLYPDIQKDDAFKAYYTPLSDTTPLSNGYIKPMLIQTLVTNYPKNLTVSSMECAVTPATPSSFSQSSPDGIYQDNGFMSDIDSSYPAYDPVVSEFNNTLQ